MNYYVFIDDHNGHFCTYHNFKTNATKEQIDRISIQMKKDNPVYDRVGSKIQDLIKCLRENGFAAFPEKNNINRCAVDRIQIFCISGNY